MLETYAINLERLKDVARENRLILNPDQERVEKVIGLMAKNYDLTQEWICPCKQTVKPAIKGKDITCPCEDMLEEVREQGCCFCKLFYTEEKVKEV